MNLPHLSFVCSIYMFLLLLPFDSTFLLLFLFPLFHFVLLFYLSRYTDVCIYKYTCIYILSTYIYISIYLCIYICMCVSTSISDLFSLSLLSILPFSVIYFPFLFPFLFYLFSLSFSFSFSFSSICFIFQLGGEEDFSHTGSSFNQICCYFIYSFF